MSPLRCLSAVAPFLLLLSGCAYGQASGYAPQYPPGYDDGMGSGDVVQPGDLFGGQNVESVEQFFDPLANYGQWTDTRFGYAFVPAVPQGWRPYVNGRWGDNRLWISDDPWGWATDHYGRWGFDDGIGWVWVPGTEWAPSWVAWRENDNVAGWAPIPPGVNYSVSVGFGGGYGFDDFNSWYGPSWVWVSRPYLYRPGFGNGPLPWQGGRDYWRSSQWQRQSGWNGRPGYGNWNRPGMGGNRPPQPLPGAGRPDYQRPGTGQPGYQRPGAGRPDDQRPDIDRPGFPRPGMTRPDGQRPDYARQPGQNGNWQGRPRPDGTTGQWQGQPRPDGSTGQWQGRPRPDGTTTQWQGRPGRPGTPGGQPPVGGYNNQPPPQGQPQIQQQYQPRPQPPQGGYRQRPPQPGYTGQQQPTGMRPPSRSDAVAATRGNAPGAGGGGSFRPAPAAVAPPPSPPPRAEPPAQRQPAPARESRTERPD